ncbi:DUF3618 domain-containing protein [Sphingomonas sp.]|uniref:DUF3618 domain-containing protein n=1 Tax=Sphingomonas sp. TaxID=28214 RepID=UPI00286E2163|nr:DUF3618 domain-containing protein [Sphingomonas sp.]
MTEPTQVAAARIKAERARAQLMETASELQARLNPKNLAREAWEGAKNKGADLAEEAIDAVRSRPYAAGGVLAALALFLAREPLIDAAGKIADGMGAKREAKRTRKRSTKKTKTETA